MFHGVVSTSLQKNTKEPIKHLCGRYCQQQMERRERRERPEQKIKGARLKLLITYGQTSNENEAGHVHKRYIDF